MNLPELFSTNPPPVRHADSLDIRQHVVRTRLHDDIYQYRQERVCALVLLQVSYQTWTSVYVLSEAQLAQRGRRRTEDDLAAVEHADELVPRCLVMVDLEDFCACQCQSCMHTQNPSRTAAPCSAKSRKPPALSSPPAPPPSSEEDGGSASGRSRWRGRSQPRKSAIRCASTASRARSSDVTGRGGTAAAICGVNVLREQDEWRRGRQGKASRTSRRAGS
jgi:hypothetical protein